MREKSGDMTEKKKIHFWRRCCNGMNQYSSCVGKWNKGELYFLMMAGSQISGSDMCRWTEDIAGMLQAMLEQHGQGQFIIGVSTWKYDGKRDGGRVDREPDCAHRA